MKKFCEKSGIKSLLRIESWCEELLKKIFKKLLKFRSKKHNIYVTNLIFSCKKGLIYKPILESLDFNGFSGIFLELGFKKI
jgi:hypothetical protein